MSFESCGRGDGLVVSVLNSGRLRVQAQEVMSFCCVLGLKPRYSHCTSFHRGPGRSKLGSDNPESV